jgi:hypothetical protein
MKVSSQPIQHLWNNCNILWGERAGHAQSQIFISETRDLPLRYGDVKRDMSDREDGAKEGN